MYEAIRGQERAIKLLRAAVSTGRIAHAYLFSGPEGVGKYTTAKAFAAALLCAAPAEGAACGQCPACRLFFGAGHPDFHEIATGETAIGIDQIRQLVLAVGRKPFHHRHVVVMDNVERATVEAQNAFLKTLEEAPGHTVFLLVTAHPEALLPTIVSRCCELRFLRLSPQVVAAVLQEAHGLPETEARLLAALSGGSLGRALSLKAPENWSLRKSALELAFKPSLHAAQEVPVRGRREAEEFLGFLLLCYRDLLVYRFTGEPQLLFNIDALPAFSAVRFSTAQVLAATQVLSRARRMLRANVNPRLVVEGVAVRLGALFREGK